MKKDDSVYLNDILSCINKIEMYIAGLSRETALSVNYLRDAVYRNFEVIGEAAKRLSDDFVEEHPELNLHQVIGMRNQLIHGYDDIRDEIVWKTIKDDLPILKKQIKKILKSGS